MCIYFGSIIYTLSDLRVLYTCVLVTPPLCKLTSPVISFNFSTNSKCVLQSPCHSNSYKMHSTKTKSTRFYRWVTRGRRRTCRVGLTSGATYQTNMWRLPSGPWGLCCQRRDVPDDHLSLKMAMATPYCTTKREMPRLRCWTNFPIGDRCSKRYLSATRLAS
jgi:hypothetical protein